MGDFKPGDTVDVYITGAKVVEQNKVWVKVSYPCMGGADFPGEWIAQIDTDSPNVNVCLVTPVDWPPVPGDLWRDNHGQVWFCRIDDSTPYLMAASDHYHGATAAVLAETRGPMTLVHREEPAS